MIPISGALKNRIAEQCLQRGLSGVPIYCFESVDSTMEAAARWLAASSDPAFQGALLEPPGAPRDGGAIFFSTSQSAGRGREGRRWDSPTQVGIYVTFVIDPRNLPSPPVGLPLVFAVALGAMLRAFGIHSGYKWPNDLLIEVDPRRFGFPRGKIAGILLESSSSAGAFGPILAGIGVNVLQERFPPEVPGVSMRQVLGRDVDYAEVCAALLESVLARLEEYRRSGFEPFRTQWWQDALFKDTTLEILTPRGDRVLGRMRGITEDGGLIIEESDGGEQRLYSVTQLRPIE